MSTVNFDLSRNTLRQPRCCRLIIVANFVADIWILRDLSLGQADITKVADRVAQHTAALKHAFSCMCPMRIQIYIISFYARQLYRQALMRARISYGDSVCPSVCHDPVRIQGQLR